MLVRILYAALVALAMAGPAIADNLKPFEGPRPLAVMMQSNPWASVIGSDTPSFVLYEDGQVVYLKVGPNRTAVYMSKRLAPDEMYALKAKLAAFVPAVAPKKLIDLMPGMSDQPLTRFFIDIGGKRLVAAVYGMGRVPNMEDRSDVKPDVLPAQIKGLNALLSDWSIAGAEPWAPKYIEAMVWNYDYAPGMSIHWPKEWPGLKDPTTWKRSEGYSIFLPGAVLPKLRAFLKTQKDKGAVEIDGQKWAVSVRYAFPGEKTWRAAFAERE